MYQFDLNPDNGSRRVVFGVMGHLKTENTCKIGNMVGGATM